TVLGVRPERLIARFGCPRSVFRLLMCAFVPATDAFTSMPHAVCDMGVCEGLLVALHHADKTQHEAMCSFKKISPSQGPQPVTKEQKVQEPLKSFSQSFALYHRHSLFNSRCRPVRTDVRHAGDPKCDKLDENGFMQRINNIISSQSRFQDKINQHCKHIASAAGGFS
ncbi:hypothetical protein CHS0354_013734, partial [Potamilus streckersoni]